MLKNTLLFSIGATVIISAGAHACTFQQGQQKMIEVNNLLQTYNRKMLDGDRSYNETKRQTLAEQSAQVGVLFASQSENASAKTLIDESVCQKYDHLKKIYALSEHDNQPANTQPSAVNASCSSNQLWQRYAVANQKQLAMFKAGSLNKNQANEFTKLGTKIGQYSTTDLAKACELLASYESKLR